MAHAVSGSAYSAKGGNLKFADVVRERFRGPAFGQDFTTWLDEVLLGFETANISESSQVTRHGLAIATKLPGSNHDICRELPYTEYLRAF